MNQPPSPTPDFAPVPRSAAINVAAPLSSEQLHAIAQGQTRATKIRRAVKVASADAYIMAFFTIVVAISIPMDYVSAIPLALAFAFITYNSFRGAARLKRFDPAAPRLLALNQVALAVAIILYAAYSLVTALRGSGALSKEFASLPADMSGDIQSLTVLIYKILYLSLIAGTIIAQGLTGLYYGTRAKVIRDFLAETPGWVVDLQKRQAGT